MALNKKHFEQGVQKGLINESALLQEYEMAGRSKYLKKHEGKIWQADNGYWYTYLPVSEGPRKLKLVKKKEKEDLDKAIIAFYKSIEEAPTIEDIFSEAMIKSKELNQLGESSISTYNTIYKRHFSDFGKKSISSISMDAFAEFLDKTTATHDLTRKGFNDLKGIATIIIKNARKLKYITYNPIDVFTVMSTNPNRLRVNFREDDEEVFSDEELDLVIHHLLDHLDMRNLGILLMFVTGIRVGELCTLKKSDLKEFNITIRRTESKVNRGGYCEYVVKDRPKTKAGWRTAEVPEDYEWVLDELRKLNPDGEYCFVEDGERLHTNSFRKRMERICKHLKITKKSPHKIRKTYATILLDNHVDYGSVIKQMGHTSIDVTYSYYYKSRMSDRGRQSEISNISEFKKRNDMEA